MRDRLLNLLRCPSCRGAFEVKAFEQGVAHGQPDVIEGLLSCACGAAYPIVRSIPRVLDDAPTLFPAFYTRHPPQVAERRGGPGRRETDALTAHERREVDRTRESFGYQWTHFSEMATDFRQNFLDYIHPIDESFFPGKLGIDVGCGFGRHIYNAALFGAEMVGMDISDAIESTRTNTMHMPNVHLVQADIYNPPFAEGTFDFAYSIGVLHHLPDPEAAFRRVTTLARPGGSVFIWVYSKKRAVTNLFLGCARAVTTRMPAGVQNTVSLVAAGVDWAGFILPFRVLSTVRPLAPVLNALPRLKTYSKYPFQVVWADWFDRLAAPIRFYYDGRDLDGWLTRAGLIRKTISPTGLYGWRAKGERS